MLLRNSTPSEKRQKDEKTLNLDEYKNQVIDNVIKLFCCCLVTKSCPNLLRPHSLWPTRLCPWNFPGKNTGVGCHFLSRGSSSPRDQPHVSSLAGRFSITEPPGKPNKAILNTLFIQSNAVIIWWKIELRQHW